MSDPRVVTHPEPCLTPGSERESLTLDHVRPSTTAVHLEHVDLPLLQTEGVPLDVELTSRIALTGRQPHIQVYTQLQTLRVYLQYI